MNFTSSLVALDRFPLRYRKLAIFLFSLAIAYVVFVADVQNNPPGFFVDESSVSYNAYTIARNGTDESGNRWPLYFRPFATQGDPVGIITDPFYIYLLAAVFSVTGPSIFVSRLFAATLGFAAACVIGVIILRVSGSRKAALAGGFIAALTPWLFEMTRIGMELCVLPLVLSVFLLALHNAYQKQKWTWLDSLAIAVTLGLFTYTYSVCRLLGPLLALGLVLFSNRARLAVIVRTLFIYAVIYLPLVIFALRNPGALTSRFDEMTYVGSDISLLETALQFIRHYLGNLNLWALLVEGDPDPCHHVPGIVGSILIVPFILAGAGILIVLCRHRRDPWWLFMLYGLAASIVPASLTNDSFQTFRMAAVPVFLLLFMSPALLTMIAMAEKESRWQKGVMMLAGLILIQATLFQIQYHRDGPKRTLDFDAEFQSVFSIATGSSNGPFYFTDEAYVHACWYGTLQGINVSRFIRINDEKDVPERGMVISYNGKQETDRKIIAQNGYFVAYLKSE